MNWDLVKPWASKIARNGLQTIGAGLASHGYIQGGAGTEAFIGAGMTLAGLFWDWWVKVGADQTAALLKKLTAQATHKDAIKAAEVLPPAAAVDTTLKAASVQSAVAKVLIVAFAVSLLLASGSAFAQAPKLTGNLAKDIATATGKPAAATAGTTTADPGTIDNAFANFNSKVQTITKDLVDKAIADVTAAQTDAQKHNDAISKPCWDSTLTLLQSLPTQWETPPTTIGIALGIQIQRDLLNSITGNDAASLKVACAALWGDQLKIVANVAGLLGIRIATGGLF